MRTLIEEEYKKLSSGALSVSGTCNVINNIIQIKLQEPTLRNINQDLSVDIKLYINSLINQAELGRIGYDSIEVKKIKEILIDLSPKENLSLINYFIRQLQKSSFDNEMRGFQKLRIKIIIKKYSGKNEFYKPASIWNLCMFFPQYNILTLFITLLFLSLIVTLLLLPAPFKFMEVLNFDINYQKLNPNFFINHTLNILGAFVGIETDFKIVPKNSLSMLVFILTKIFAFLFIANYLFTKLSEFLKR